MMLLGCIRQHRCECPLISACALGNLVIMIFYVTSHSNGSLEPPDELKDDNGIALFLHEPLGTDEHRNSLKHPHPVRRMKISFRPKAQLKELRGTGPGPQDSRVSSNEGDSALDVENQEVKYHFKGLKDGDNGKPGLLLDELTDNANEVIQLNKQKVIPFQKLHATSPNFPQAASRNPSFIITDNDHHVHFINQGDEEMNFQPRGRDPDKPDPGTVKVLFSPTSMCEDNTEVYLLIAVVSDIRRFKLRNAIRRTWGRAAASGRFATKLIFVVGKPRERESPLNKMIVAENNQFRDIMYLNLEDKHTILTYKTLTMFQWTLEYCNQAKYVMKCDDDVFINIPNILQDLKVRQGQQPTRFMLGHVIEGAKPITDRHDKWFLPGSQFKGKTYPPYLSGSAYVLPSTLLEPIMQQSRETKMFWLEDVYITGILGKEIMATVIHSSKFEFRKRKLGPCRFKKLNSAHGLSPDHLVFVWREMNRANLMCADTDGQFLWSLDY